MRAGGRLGPLRLVASTLRGRRRDLTGLMLWAAVEALPAYVSGRLVASAIDRGFLAGHPGAGFALLGLFAGSIVIGAWGARQTFRRLTVLVEPFRDELVVATVSSAIRRSAAVAGGAGGTDLGAVARLTRQVEIGREALASLLLVAQGFVVTMGSALLGLVTLVPAAAALVLPPLAAGIGLFLAALPRMTGSKREAILADEGLAVSATSMATGLRDIAASGGEGSVEREVGAYVDAEARATRRVARLAMVGAVAVGVGGWLPVVLLLAAGSWLRRHGATTGALLGALTYVLEGTLPALQSLVRELGETGAWLTVAMRRIAEGGAGSPDLAEPGPAGAPAVPATGAPATEARAREAPGAPEAPAEIGGRGRPAASVASSSNGAAVRPQARGDGGDLVVRDLTFRYGVGAEPIVQGLDLVLPAGDHLAIVGPSGAGKSTLAGLMAGMLRPERGDVILGGTPVLSFDRSSLAGRRVLVPQESYVFSGSLRENLTYLDPAVPDAALDRAVDELRARALVERIGGYDAEVAPASLSAGEQQLLSLVRAWLASAPIVLLDEATCHLDPAAEEHAERAFARRGGTLVVVAHRISSARRARRILVLDGAEVVLGTHDDLLTRSPLYRDLVGCWAGGARVTGKAPPHPGQPAPRAGGGGRP